MSEYAELPWSVEDTIENLKELKEGLQERCIIQNLHGRGEKDAEEVAFDFDRAIKALEEVQQYRAIGTPEECRENKEFLEFLYNRINPNDMEQYLSMYHGLNENLNNDLSEVCMKGIRKKILPCYFEDVKARKKNFEIRKDEDDIQVGDTLVLCEWDGTRYTRRELSRKVKYVLRNVPQYGLQDGFCIIGW